MAEPHLSVLRIYAADGNNLLARLDAVLREVIVRPEIQRELLRLTSLRQQIEILKNDLIVISFQRFEKEQLEDIVKASQDKLRQMSSLAEEVLNIAEAIKKAHVDAHTCAVIDEWLDSGFLQALASNPYQQRLLKYVQTDQ